MILKELGDLQDFQFKFNIQYLCIVRNKLDNRKVNKKFRIIEAVLEY